MSDMNEIVRLRTKTIRLAVVAQNAMDWLENAPIEYSNGVTHNGMDEGNVRGWEGHKKLVADLQFAIESYHRGENDV